MFQEKYEKRLQSWHDFRATLETHPDPLQHTIDAYRHVPVGPKAMASTVVANIRESVLYLLYRTRNVLFATVNRTL